TGAPCPRRWLAPAGIARSGRQLAPSARPRRGSPAWLPRGGRGGGLGGGVRGWLSGPFIDFSSSPCDSPDKVRKTEVTTMETAMIDEAVASPLGHGEARQLAETEFAAMVAQLRSLSPKDWARPTVCELWDVRAMASHVLGMAEAQASFRQFAHDFRAASKRTG